MNRVSKVIREDATMSVLSQAIGISRQGIIVKWTPVFL